MMHTMASMAITPATHAMITMYSKDNPEVGTLVGGEEVTNSKEPGTAV